MIRSLRALLGLLLAIAALASCGEGGERADDTEAGEGTPVGEAGDPLPDGLSVPEDTVLIAPPLFSGPQADHQRWTAITMVTGDPLIAWRDLLAQLQSRAPDAGIDPAGLVGCHAPQEYRESVCEIAADAVDVESGSAVRFGGTLVSVPDDITGAYLLLVVGYRTAKPLADDLPANPAFEGKLPSPEAARTTPNVGDPLALSTAYEGDDEEYVLLEGSTLLSQWGIGSITGGFDVLLEVDDGIDPVELATKYAVQAAQSEGETETETFEEGGITYTRFNPPGGAGGYSGRVTLVDQPEGADYIYYTLVND